MRGRHTRTAFSTSFILFNISKVGVSYVTAGLKKSLSEKREWQDVAYEGLVCEQ